MIYSTLIQMASWILCRAIVISVTFYWNIRYRSNEIFQRESKGSAFKFLLNSNTDSCYHEKKTLVILLFYYPLWVPVHLCWHHSHAIFSFMFVTLLLLLGAARTSKSKASFTSVKRRIEFWYMYIVTCD